MILLSSAVGPLVAGDRLTREEFLDRWEEMPNVKKAELIGGIVYMPSPVSDEHGEKDSTVHFWLKFFAMRTPGVKTGGNATWFMLEDAPQPDAHLRVLRENGGASWVGEDGYLNGAPELAVEVSRSSAAYDLHQKKALYLAAGVKEYLALVLEPEEARWHRLVGDSYQTIPPGPDGIVRSIVFPGLWLDAGAFLKDDLPAVLHALERGLASPEHAAFVEFLRGRKS